jgi:hypothetical protein
MIRRGARFRMFARLGAAAGAAAVARIRAPGAVVCAQDRDADGDDRVLRDRLDDLPAPAMPPALRARIVRMVPRLPQLPPVPDSPVAAVVRSPAPVIVLRPQAAPAHRPEPVRASTARSIGMLAAAIIALVTGAQQIGDESAVAGRSAVQPARAAGAVMARAALPHALAAPHRTTIHKAAAAAVATPESALAQAAPVDPAPQAEPPHAESTPQPELAAVRPVMGPIDIPQGTSAAHARTGMMGPFLPQPGYGFAGGMGGGEFTMGPGGH